MVLSRCPPASASMSPSTSGGASNWGSYGYSNSELFLVCLPFCSAWSRYSHVFSLKICFVFCSSEGLGLFRRGFSLGAKDSDTKTSLRADPCLGGPCKTHHLGGHMSKSLAFAHCLEPIFLLFLRLKRHKTANKLNNNLINDHVSLLHLHRPCIFQDHMHSRYHGCAVILAALFTCTFDQYLADCNRAWIYQLKLLALYGQILQQNDIQKHIRTQIEIFIPFIFQVVASAACSSVFPLSRFCRTRATSAATDIIGHSSKLMAWHDTQSWLLQAAWALTESLSVMTSQIPSVARMTNLIQHGLVLMSSQAVEMQASCSSASQSTWFQTMLSIGIWHRKCLHSDQVVSWKIQTPVLIDSKFMFQPKRETT